MLTNEQKEKVAAGMDHLCQALRDEYVRTRDTTNQCLSMEASSTYKFTDMPNVSVTVTARIEESHARQT